MQCICFSTLIGIIISNWVVVGGILQGSVPEGRANYDRGSSLTQSGSTVKLLFLASYLIW